MLIKFPPSDFNIPSIQCLVTNQLEQEGGPGYVNLQNRYGWTALMQACCYGHSGSVVQLLQREADVQFCNAWKASSLVVASQGGHFGVVHILINHGAKVRASLGRGGYYSQCLVC